MGDSLRVPTQALPTDSTALRSPAIGAASLAKTQAPADSTIRPVPLPTRVADTVARPATGAAVPALALVDAAAKGPAAVDFTRLFAGFGPGKDLDLSVGVPFSGGNGKLVALSPHGLNLHMHVKVIGVYSGDVDFRIAREGDHFRMSSPQNWKAEITQTDSTITVKNADNPAQWVAFTRKKDAIQVRTGGLGQDGRKATLKVDD
jgi:hypothetical protein